ncbi:MAG: divalent-cation tolerance protein CutA [Candidatus Lokiarchaeota archaeon]|nr:divalent-cation tolerance protein CutA [Candidatus Lokiarchaeota archaeon]
MTNYIYFSTVSSEEEAKKIATYLVENKVVACVNIINNIASIYTWEGKMEQSKEHLLIIKTSEEKSDELIHTIESLHSYDTPECIGIKIEKGSQKYLKWIKDVVN